CDIAQRIVFGTNHKREIARVWNLFIRKIELPGRLSGPVPLLYIPDDADNLTRIGTPIIYTNMLPDCILVGEDTPSECLVDYRHSRAPGCVPICEVSSGKQLNPHRVKVVGSRNPVDRSDFVSRRRNRPAVDSQPASPDVSRTREGV